MSLRKRRQGEFVLKNLLLIAAYLICGTASQAVLAQGKNAASPTAICTTCDFDESGGNGGEIRATETFSPTTGIYEADLVDGIAVAIDRQTGRLYVQNVQGIQDIAITDQALADAGITRQQFDEMLSAYAPAYQSAYDLNGDGLRNDGANLNTCAGASCSPWTPVSYNSSESLTFDRVQLLSQGSAAYKNSAQGMTLAASTACRDLRDYSYMGLKAAVVVGVACAVTVGLGCASAVAGLAYYTYRRQQAFAQCR
ncbi:hypothetical protein [Thermomonas mangrovi]|uniref:hypothetical protein n=1 Tax=Thermomonas mangrovi TaxID=2993316 RepID=UPI00230812E9|nr:hypothetical protein [Thermomonas mangrovi]